MMKEQKQFIYGKHVVSEVLQHMPQSIVSILFIGAADVEIQGQAKKADISFAVVKEDRVPDSIPEPAVHQNVIAEIDMSRLVQDYKTFIQTLEVNPNTGIVLLGEVQDPHNVGAVIRNAAAFGMAGVLIPEHNQAPVSAAAIKVSAGMAFRVPLVSIGNVNTTIEDLKEKGFWIYGLAGEGETAIQNESFEAPTVLVLGNESKGIREKTREHCDILLSIPIDDRCESLNASVSAGIAMHNWYQKQKK